MLKPIVAGKAGWWRDQGRIGVAMLAGALTLFFPGGLACHAWVAPGLHAYPLEARAPSGIAVAQERRQENQTPAEGYRRLEDELARKGEEAFAVEDYAQAELVFRSLVQHNPDDIRGLLGLGKVYYATKQYDGAADAYYEALRLDRNNVAALTGLGKINLALLKWDQAFEFFQEVAEIDESRAEARQYVDNLLQGRFGAAEDLPAEYYSIMLSPAITREELAALVYVRSFHLQAITSEPEIQIMTDISDRWARPYILEVTKHRIMSVFPNHTFMPQTTVTRGEFAQVLHNVLQQVGVKQEYGGEPGKRISFTDVDPSNRYFPAIQAICSLGIMAPVADSSFHPSDLVSGSEAVEAFNKLETVANLGPSGQVPLPLSGNSFP